MREASGCCSIRPARTSRTSSMVRDLKHRFVDGLILASLDLTGAHTEELRRAAAPVVVIGRPTKGTPVDVVRAHSRKGAAAAVRHLHEAGRRRIAFVNGPHAHRAGSPAQAGATWTASARAAFRGTTTCRGRGRLHDRARPQRHRAPARASAPRRDPLRERPAGRRHSRRCTAGVDVPARWRSSAWTTRRSAKSPGRR